MKTHFNSDGKFPEYDRKIVDWLNNYDKNNEWGDTPRRVGIIADIGGSKYIYRAIDGDGINEIDDAYKFLESIGLVDLRIYNHPRFNCVYGLPEDMPTQSEPISDICFK
jgi:hypothetical protein